MNEQRKSFKGLAITLNPSNRCENLMTCPMKEIGSGAEHCPFDWLAVHDGRDENAPVIGQFCGMGKFPFSIIGNFQYPLDKISRSIIRFSFHRNIAAHVC